MARRRARGGGRPDRDRRRADRRGDAGAAPPGDAERLAGLTLPGLANAHSHAFQRALRGRTQAGEGSFWTWREQMYELADRLDPDSYLDLARATFAEMALAGITLVGEFHYLHHAPDGAPYDDPNAMGEAVIEAAAAGRHPHHAARRLLPARRACALPRRGRRRLGGARGRASTDGPALRVGAAIHSVRAVDAEAARTVAAWARAAGRCTRTSPSSRRERDLPRRLRRNADRGAGRRRRASERFTAVHATHLTDDDVALLGRAATCCLCPTTERDLGDGIGPARRLRDAGARLALGSDSQAVIDLFEEARAIELDERLARARAACTGRPSCCARPRRAATRPSAGPTAAGSSRARSPTWSRSRSTACVSRAPGRARRRGGGVRGGARATCAT